MKPSDRRSHSPAEVAPVANGPAIAPHFIDTPLLASPFHHAGARVAPPSRDDQLALVRRYGAARVVAAVERAIARGRPRILVGGEALWIETLRRVLPGVLRRVVRRRYRQLMSL